MGFWQAPNRHLIEPLVPGAVEHHRKVSAEKRGLVILEGKVHDETE